MKNPYQIFKTKLQIIKANYNILNICNKINKVRWKYDDLKNTMCEWNLMTPSNFGPPIISIIQATSLLDEEEYLLNRRKQLTSERKKLESKLYDLTKKPVAKK